MVHRDADPLINVLVMKNMMPVAVKQKGDRQQCYRSGLFVLVYFQGIFLPKGAPLHILTTETYVDSVLEQRAKGHILPKSPVAHTLTHHVCTALQDASQTWKITAISTWTVALFWLKREDGGIYRRVWWSLLVGPRTRCFRSDRAVVRGCRWSYSSLFLVVHPV